LPRNDGWPPEIDVFEHPRNGQITPPITTATNHYLDGSGTHIIDSSTIDLRTVSGFPSNIDLTTGYHTYGLSWRADYIDWYLDGIRIKRVSNTFHQNAYPLWDIAVGGWGGSPNFSTGTTEMHIRSARVYL
jgi:beta-glucanase (GH16 family)